MGLNQEENTAVETVEPQQFIDLIVKEIRAGGGLVPFIGSGFSAASGIIMGQDFDQYLAHTVFLCVAEESQKTKQSNKSRWNLRKFGWPNYPTSEQAETAKKWIEEQFVKIETERKHRAEKPKNLKKDAPEWVAMALTSPLTPRTMRRPPQTELRRLLGFLGSDLLVHGGYNVSGYSPTSEDAIRERAIRSLHDWRATLNFLSEIKLTDDNRLLLDNPDPSVIDSFNVHITKGRKPNLAHNMLCHLAGPARFRVILTTNFDTLIEDAFARLNEHTEAISVSIKGTLPDPDLVHASNTVVKLHGTRWETRADFSLDESPSADNLNRFFHYVRCRYPDEVAQTQHFIPSNLLVCGYSGSDKRCMEMIKFVLDAGDSKTRIYWVCHSDKGLNNLKAIFSESYKGRVIAVSTPRTDLLLYELYQHLCLSLPKGGFSYQYTANVPPSIPSNLKNRLRLKDLKDGEMAEAKCRELVKWFDEKSDKRPRVMDGKPGALATLRNSVEYIGEKKYGHILWLELEDYPDVTCLAYELCLVISIRLGLFQLGHADIVPAKLIKEIQLSSDFGCSIWIKHIGSLITSYFNIEPALWLVVLYGRNGAGGCSGWEDGVFWDKSQNAYLSAFIQALSKCNFRVIYAPYSEERLVRDKAKSDKLRLLMARHLGKQFDTSKWKDQNANHPTVHSPSFGKKIAPDKNASSKDKNKAEISFDSTMTYLLRDWIKNDSGIWSANEPARERYRFLYASSLFRQSRHYSAFLNDGIIKCPRRFNWVGFDNDWARNKTMSKYRQELINCNFFYEKPGGFAWAYKDFRLGIRRMIENLPENWSSFNSQDSFEPFITWRSNNHYWIADWYLRAFYTTGHATPLMEALFHLYQTICNLATFRQHGKFLNSSGKSNPAAEKAWRRYRRWRNAICDMIKVLRVGRHTIRLWFGPAQFQAWFSKKTTDQVLSACELSSGISDKLDLAPKQLSLLKRHAGKLHGLLRCEFERLVPLGQGGGRYKEFDSYVLESAIKVERTGSSIDNVSLCDSTFWKEGGSIVCDLCEAVSVLQLQKKESYITQIKALSSGVTKIQRQFLRQNFQDEYYFEAIQQLNEWAALMVRRAKMRERYLQLHASDKLGRDEVSKKLWVTVSVLCNTALDFSRLLHPGLESFEIKERIKALCIYAIGLSRLHRFYEAHRRLNEANAILSKYESQENKVLLGILQLRRAEVHLTECTFLKWLAKADVVDIEREGLDNDHLMERYDGSWSKGRKEALMLSSLAKLDDAWCCLENAESLLAGQTHSPRWWARLCMLKLQCLSAYHENTVNVKIYASAMPWKNSTLARRVHSHPLHQILDIMNKGLASCHGYYPLQLFVFDYAFNALQFASDVNGSVTTEIKIISDQILYSGIDNTRKQAGMTETMHMYVGELRKKLDKIIGVGD